MNLNRILFVPIPANRVYGLDVLRAAAILFVLLGHGSALLQGHFPDAVLNAVTLDGVSIFFVLSGFLIGRILLVHLERNGNDLRSILDFWIRRWFRTIPTYFVVLTFLIVLRTCASDQPPIAYWTYYLFSQNLYTPHPSFFNEAWSLSVEEWFYLTLPVVLFALGRFFRSVDRYVPYVCISAMLAVMWVRYDLSLTMQVDDYGDWDIHFRKVVATRLDSLMYGVLGAWISLRHPARWVAHKRSLFVLGILLMVADKYLFMYRGALNLDWRHYYTTFSFSVFSLGALLTLPLLASMRAGSGVLFNALTRISIISYSLYLVHFSVVRLIVLPGIFGAVADAQPVWNIAARYAVFWALSLVCAVLLYKYVEVPTTAWRDRFSFGKRAVRTVGE